MQIKIEIDVRPEELRRFLGLPDIAGLQEELIDFVRNKVGQASESFDAAAFVKGNLKLLGRNPTLRKLLAAGRRNSSGDPAKAAASPAASSPKSRQAGKAAPKAGAGLPRAPAKRARKPKIVTKAAAPPEPAPSETAPPQTPADD